MSPLFETGNPRLTFLSLKRDLRTGRTGRSARRIESPCPVRQLQSGSRRRLRHADGGIYWEAPADSAKAC